MAGSYAAKHESEIAGLIFLAAYPTRELQTLPVLSLYGSEDGVLNMEKYQEAIGLAADCREYVLEGGNHAGFGNYGSQKGDVAGNDRLHHGHDPAATGGKVAEPRE